MHGPKCQGPHNPKGLWIQSAQGHNFKCMAERFICRDQKYQVGGEQKEDTIVLPVFPVDLPEKIDVEGYTLLLKTSFHVSLVCIGKIIEKYSVLIPDFINKVVNDFCEFVQTNSIDFLRYRNEFSFVTQSERRSVVVMCDVSNLDKFSQFVNQKYRLKVEYPPTHITLYTLQPDKGIYLTNSEDIKQLTEPIPNPGLSLG